MMKKSQWPQPLQASKEDEQMLKGSQLHGVCGLPQRWASPSTYEGWEEVQEEQQKKEKKPKHESFAIFGEWVSGGEESSASSSDESNKKFTTRMGSSSNTCFMAKDMDSDVSDDDSDSPSIDKLLDLVHEHQKVTKKQSKEIKNINALKI